MRGMRVFFLFFLSVFLMIFFFRIRAIPGETSITGALVSEPMFQLNVCSLGWMINSITVRSVACVQVPCHYLNRRTTTLNITLYIPLSTV